MNNFKYIIIIILIGLVVEQATAQQDPQYSFYNYQMNLINPAYAGSSDKTNITLGLRSQWAGVPGAPETQSALFSTSVGKNLGLGVSILNDKTFVETQTWFAIDFAYKVQLNEKLDLFMGLKVSGSTFNINSSGLITYGVAQDATLMDFNSKFSPNIGVGAYLRHEKYFVSLSAPRLLSNDRLEQENGIASFSQGKQHVYLSAGYKFMLGANTTLLASSIYRYVDAAPSSVDMTGVFDFNKRFELGVSYRVDTSISGLFMFNVSNGFKIGYAYEAPTDSKVNAIDNGSHELFLRLQL